MALQERFMRRCRPRRKDYSITRDTPKSRLPKGVGNTSLRVLQGNDNIKFWYHKKDLGEPKQGLGFAK